MMLEVPTSLDWLRSSSRGRAWLATLPGTVAALSDRWGLELEEPFPDSYVSLVLPVRNHDFVLKVQFPHRESATEAAALRLWAGNGAVRLIAEAPEHHALLLERCIPGSYLAGAGQDAALSVMIDLLPRLWIATTTPFPTLADEAERWVGNLPGEFDRAGRPFARSLLDAAIEVLQDLAASQGERVLLHQDLHGHNILRAQREPWLVIDPKPLVGEREFGVSPLIRSGELGHSRQNVLRRLDRLTDELELDRERARLWACGHAIAWGFDGTNVLPHHIETARWLLEA
jgi:streptomycin 6-kinase